MFVQDDPLPTQKQREALESAALAHAGLAAWLKSVAPAIEAPEALKFRTAYAAAARKLGAAGRAPLWVPKDLDVVTRPHWTLLDIGRAMLLARALAHLEWQARAGFVQRVLDSGEQGEQMSLLRTLALLPECERFANVAVSACRTNSVSVFEAIACENPYPARLFPELGFNQMVIKAIFLEVSVRRIEGLPARVTSELVRMARDLESERHAAGRSIPGDIPYIVEFETRS